MSNLLIHHPSPEVRVAAVRLLDALTTWERTTGGRNNLVIIKDTIGVEYRSLSGSPVPEHVTDEELLDSFNAMMEDELRDRNTEA